MRVFFVFYLHICTNTLHWKAVKHYTPTYSVTTVVEVCRQNIYFIFSYFILFDLTNSLIIIFELYLNYYLSCDVCACFRLCPPLSIFVRLCPSFFKKGCTHQKMLVYKDVTFLKRIKMAIWFLIFFDQIRPKWIKLDQIGFPHQSKEITKNKNGHLIFDFFLIRSVQNGSNLIKLDFSSIKKCYYKKLSHLQKG